MKIGIITQWFDPEPGPAALSGELARAMAARGHEVQVLTGFPNYPQGHIYPGYKVRWRTDEVSAGVRIRRVAVIPYHGRSIFGRIANYASFGISGSLFAGSALADCDVVWCYYSPVTVGAILLSRRRTRRVPSVLHIMDLWPDNVRSAAFVNRGALLKMIEASVGAWNHLIYRHAVRVLTIASGAGAVLSARGVPESKLRYRPLWANEGAFGPSNGEHLRAALGIPDDAVVVMYAGTLGKTQRVDKLIQAMADLKDSVPQLLCLVAGSGTEEDSLRQLAAKCGIEGGSVQFLGRIPMEAMAEYVAASDLQYIGLEHDRLAEITMPSKFQATIACGRAVLSDVPGDLHELVTSRGLGFSAIETGLTEALRGAASAGRPALAELGQHAGEIYKQEFSLDAAVDEIEVILSEAALSRRNLPRP